jgi:hypothetical protein
MGSGTASSRAEEHRSACLQRGRVTPIRPVPLAPGAEESRLHAEKDVAILLEYRPELSNVAEDAVHVLRIGAIVPAGEPVREPDDRLQAVLPGRREGSPDFIELLRGEIAFLEGLQVDFDQQQGDPALAQPVQPADAVAHPRRVEATLRIREVLRALPVADLPPCRRLLGLRPPRREA